MKIRIVADSACDIPAELIEQLDISIIPAYVNFGATQSVPDDGTTITKDELYERLKTEPGISTAAPPPGKSEEILRAALADADHVVAVHTSGELSSIINSTRVAAQAIGTDSITVLDSGSLSTGAGWSAIAAAETVAQGGSLDDVKAAVASTKQRMELWAVPETLDYLQRSGRINSLIASLGNMIQLKPFVSVARGEVKSAGRVRTFKKVPPKLVDLCREHAPLDHLAVLHIANEDGAKSLARDLNSLAPPSGIHITHASAAIGVNFGPGGLGLTLVRRA